jgi:hypothetical protein
MYKTAENALGKNNILSVSSFPMLGCDTDYYYLSEDKAKIFIQNGIDISKNQKWTYDSYYLDNIVIGSHPRFKSLASLMRARRGGKADIKIPIYEDVHTNLSYPTELEPFKGFIYMDSEPFGSGCCCFQVTLGCPTLSECTFMYDQFVVLAPILVKIIIIIRLLYQPLPQ